MANNITIGVPREIKQGEKRVGLKPAKNGVAELVKKGFVVLIEKSAGLGSGFSDIEYREAGARIVSQKELWEKSDIIVKVKEPLPEEFKFFRRDLIVFCFLHLAPNKKLTNALIKSGVTAIAYETVEPEQHNTPILRSMSLIAGRVGAIEGANLLKENKGMLLGPETNVMIVGLGNAGMSAI